jgi:hypothetical protein
LDVENFVPGRAMMQRHRNSLWARLRVR